MANGKWMQRFARWHIWLGWLIAIPLVLWTASGLIMVAKPIEEVRGEHLRAEARPIDASKAVLPALPLPISKLALIASRNVSRVFFMMCLLLGHSGRLIRW